MEAVVCPACREANPARYRLCGTCGAPLTPDRPAEEIRRVVTIVNSDLKGSTALGEKLDAESLREVLTRYFDEMRVVFESHGGTIEKIIGDAIVAVFGLPVRQDDDALRAVEAAAESMRVLAGLNDELEKTWGVRLVTRTGVSSGDVVVGDVTASQHVLTGDTMKVSSAMEQNAPPLEVLIAEPTYRLVRDDVEVEPVGPITPKGMDEATYAYRLISISPRTRSAQPLAGATAGRPGTRACANCGEEASDPQQVCGMCGAPLSAVAKAQESRKTVTIVFADPKPRTDSGGPPAPEALRDVMSRYFDEMRRALERHGGTVEKFIGDAVMAVYGLPVRHEDDAVRAMRAALDMQAALPALNEDFARAWGVRLMNHIGVNTGEVITGDATLGQRLVTGDAVNVAARLEQAAGPAEVIIGDLTYRLARDQVEVEAIPPLTLKGKAEPVAAYRLLSVREKPLDQSGREAPFVGREPEMGRLSDALTEATDGTRARMLTVVGDAGVGKSRLIKEFAANAGDGAGVARGRCLPYGDGITFWPLAEVVREAAGIAADDPPEVAAGRILTLLVDGGSDASERAAIVDRVAAAIGLSSTQFPVAELFWGARKLLESMARARPLVVILDDIHWAESTFLDLIDHLLDAVRDAPILLLCSARHELMEAHPDWSEQHAGELVVLEPLSEADSGLFIERLLGQAGLDESVMARITSAAEGNPLFVEQMVSMLIDSGMLRRQDGRWVAASAGDIAVPPTIHALLAARFDSLGTEERGVLEPASVIGLTFPIPAMEELVAEPIRARLPANLATLDRKQFVKPATLGEDEAYRFAHLLVRDTAYGSLLKRSRAALHERFVGWAERVNRERGREQEFEEILGYHLEQAYRYRSELGVVDDAAREVGRRASEKLGSSGKRAFGRGDAPAAASLLRRAASVLPPDDRRGIELLTEVAEAEIEQGEFDRAGAALDGASESARRIDDERLAARVDVIRYQLGFGVSGSIGEAEHAVADLTRAIAILQRANDLAGLARTWHLMHVIHGTRGDHERAAEAARRAVEFASQEGDSRLAARGAVGYAYSILHGPTPVAEALPRCEAMMRKVGGDRKAEAVILGILGLLHAMEGRFDRARGLCAQARQLVGDLGPSITAASTSLESSRVEMLAGDPAAAEQLLRRDYETLAAMAETYFRSTIAALLGHALWALGRSDEAVQFSSVAEELADSDDVLSQIGWRTLRAKSLAADGMVGEAVQLARDAVAIASATVDIEMHADALTDLCEVLRISGLSEQLGPPLQEALALYDRKGDLVLARAVRARLATVPGA